MSIKLREGCNIQIMLQKSGKETLSYRHMNQRHHPGEGSILLDIFSLSVLHLDTRRNWVEEDLSQAGDRLAHTEPYLKAGARADTFMNKRICEACSGHQLCSEDNAGLRWSHTQWWPSNTPHSHSGQPSGRCRRGQRQEHS